MTYAAAPVVESSFVAAERSLPQTRPPLVSSITQLAVLQQDPLFGTPRRPYLLIIAELGPHLQAGAGAI
jgi:hypothetical protein